MNEHELRKMLDDRDYLKQKIKKYEEDKLISPTRAKFEVKGHLEKARHNLEFVREIHQEYNDWKLIVCYYAAYHAALALTTAKGQVSKSHDATLCLLIMHYYDSGLTRSDIELLNMLDAKDLFFYVESKQRREDAQYSTKIKYDTHDVEKIRLKIIAFISKSEAILDEIRYSWNI